mgnify:CR=1 FL=1
MATGFRDIQRNKVNKNPGYKTLFERITEKTGGEKKSLSWYRAAVKDVASAYGKDLSRYIDSERKDRGAPNSEEDENILRTYAVTGHLYMFEYKAKMKWLPYYDKNPLVYVLKSNAVEFWGANLHYMAPKRRIGVIKNLLNGRINIPKKCFHKYLHNHVDGLYLDLASAEWDTAILLPTEDFVRNVNGHLFPYDKEYVWDETNENFYDNIKGRRVIEGYGHPNSKQMVT